MISYKSESVKFTVNFLAVRLRARISFLGNFIGLIDKPNLICGCLVVLQYSHMINVTIPKNMHI